MLFRSDRRLVLEGAREHNLRDVTLEVPLGLFVCVTGVSGSGKSTLVQDVLLRALERKLGSSRALPGKHRRLLGWEAVDKVIDIDQSPIGRTPRSNPATYTGVFDHIRSLFAQVPEARVRGYQPGRFSFNVRGGRCEPCAGDGQIKIEMHFLPDVYVTCEVCKGQRYNRETLEVRYKGRSIAEVLGMSIDEALEFFANIPVIVRHLKTLLDVGLGYVKLGQPAPTLSGGEAQRIRLATQVGSGLTGVLYVLDEPSIGLHPKDNHRLIGTLKHLRDLGNTLIVVEHDEDTMMDADYLVDMGPGAGVHGGQVVAFGTPEQVKKDRNSLTGKYLRGELKIEVPTHRRRGNGKDLRVIGAREHNLQNVSIDIPLGTMTVVTGPSGSGKSTLIHDILHATLARELNGAKTTPGRYDRIEGMGHLDKVIEIDQSPIGRTPRSNPATYTGVFTEIRDLFTRTPEARRRGYQAGRFSFNVKGGRCEHCKGDGVMKIEMNFLPDVYVQCDVCKGARYNRETLQVTYKGHTIADVLEMTVEQACEVFSAIPQAADRLRTLVDVGLGYVKLGQPAPTLSGGEAQRVKLATELSRRATGKTLYLIDEPTTGLSFYDVHKLMDVMQRLVDKGNSILVIEHNLDVIRCSDWIIDLGPEGGDKGGEIVVTGTPEEVAAHPTSHTGRYLKQVLAQHPPEVIAA